jgi:hemerythrin-like domain-containing protein
LDAFEHEVGLVATASDPDWDVLHGIAKYFCDYPDRCHHPKEDAVFRQLQVKFPDEARSIGDLSREHKDVHSRVQRFRDHIQSIFRDAIVPRDGFIGAARTFVDAERQHMRKEEQIFFPLAEKLLVREDWQQVEAQLRAEHDPLFGDDIEQEFRIVRDRLLAWQADRSG